MASGKEMLVWRSGSLFAATTLIALLLLPMGLEAQETRRMIVEPPTGWIIALLLLPMGLEAQETRRMIVEPPTGWFGVRISDQAMVDERGNAFFDSYPVIKHVDPGSPAEKAGVLPGDVLLSFNSHDMRGGTMELSKWLRAGAPFVLKVRRNEATRTIRGTLGRRPENWEQNTIVELSVTELMKQRSGAIASVTMTMAGMIRTHVR